MDIVKQRHIYNKSNKHLKRARNLFIFLNRWRLLAYGDDFMDLVVEKCQEHRLYSSTSTSKDIRFWIIRRLYRIHNPDNQDWYEWYKSRHWKPYTWKRFV